MRAGRTLQAEQVLKVRQPRVGVGEKSRVGLVCSRTLCSRGWRQGAPDCSASECQEEAFVLLGTGLKQQRASALISSWRALIRVIAGKVGGGKVRWKQEVMRQLEWSRWESKSPMWQHWWKGQDDGKRHGRGDYRTLRLTMWRMGPRGTQGQMKGSQIGR